MENTALVKAIAIISLLLSTIHGMAQPLTLERCKQMAHDNYPSIRQYGLIDKSKELTVSNAMKAWLPGVTLTGFGMAMTDVLKASPLGELKNEVYGASLSVSQVIYDGGAIGAQKQVVKAKSEVEEKQLDIQMHELNERVEQLFFGILMIDEQTKQVQLLQENLRLSEKSVRSLMQNGMANQSDLDQVQVNQVQAEQQLIQLHTMRQTYMEMLGYFIAPASPLQADAVLEKPQESFLTQTEMPESVTLAWFSSQEALLAVQRKSLDTRLLPTVLLFGMTAYHNRLLPIVKEFNLMGGVTVRWNIGALYTRKNDLASLHNQRRQMDVQRETFLFNNRLLQRQTNGQIESIRRQMVLDDKAVALRESILEKARKKVELGTETVNELLRDVNAVSEARQQKAIHELLLLQEIYKLHTIQSK
ncbi:MAG: TolC family protein [Parabacteroides sp.]